MASQHPIQSPPQPRGSEPARLLIVVTTAGAEDNGPASPAAPVLASRAAGQPLDDDTVLLLDRRAAAGEPPLELVLPEARQRARRDGRRLVVLASPVDSLHPALLESTVRVTRCGVHGLRLSALAAELGRPRNEVARELGTVSPETLSRLLRARRALLVEGPTDRAVLQTVLRRLGDTATEVIPAGSKVRLATHHALSSAFGITHHVLFDGDGGPVAGGPAQRHRVIRSRRSATDSLLVALEPSGCAWSFGGPTVIGERWSAFGTDLEAELANWPSFLSALSAHGGQLRSKHGAQLQRAAAAARLADLPSSFRGLCDAVAALGPDTDEDPGTGPDVEPGSPRPCRAPDA